MRERERDLGNGEAELGQLALLDQRDGDAVWENHLAGDDVLDDVVKQTTEKEGGTKRREEVISG